MKAKKWQIIVVALGGAALIGLGSYTLVYDAPIVMNQEFYLYDPQTNDLYFADWKKVRFSLPAMHPQTGERRLLRIKQAGGAWKVVDRDMELMERLSESNKFIQPDGTLRTEPKEPVAYTLPPLPPVPGL